MPRHARAPDTEPEESKFPKPSEKEHLFHVREVSEDQEKPGIFVVECEVVGTEESGRSLLHRVNTDDSVKGFYYCRQFLKAIGEPYKGEFLIDESRWVGRQFYATVVHNKSIDGKKTYANIDDYNFGKLIKNDLFDSKKSTSEEVSWDG